MSESTNKRSRADFEEEVKVDADADAGAAAEETFTKRCKKQIFDPNNPDVSVLLNCSEKGTDIEFIKDNLTFIVKVTRIKKLEYDGIVISFANVKKIVCEVRQNMLQKPLWQVSEEIKRMISLSKCSIYKCLFKWENRAKWIDADVIIDYSNNPKVSGHINVRLELGNWDFSDYPLFQVPERFYFLLQNGYTFSEDAAHGFVASVRDTFKHKIIGTVVEETY